MYIVLVHVLSCCPQVKKILTLILIERRKTKKIELVHRVYFDATKKKKSRPPTYPPPAILLSDSRTLFRLFFFCRAPIRLLFYGGVASIANEQANAAAAAAGRGAASPICLRRSPPSTPCYGWDYEHGGEEKHGGRTNPLAPRATTTTTATPPPLRSSYLTAAPSPLQAVVTPSSRTPVPTTPSYRVATPSSSSRVRTPSRATMAPFSVLLSPVKTPSNGAPPASTSSPAAGTAAVAASARRRKPSAAAAAAARPAPRRQTSMPCAARPWGAIHSPGGLWAAEETATPEWTSELATVVPSSSMPSFGNIGGVNFATAWIGDGDSNGDRSMGDGDNATVAAAAGDAGWDLGERDARRSSTLLKIFGSKVWEGRVGDGVAFRLRGGWSLICVSWRFFAPRSRPVRGLGGGDSSARTYVHTYLRHRRSAKHILLDN